MESQTFEETRYCPTCEKKTPHWITRVTSPTDSKRQEAKILKAECRVCRNVDTSASK